VSQPIPHQVSGPYAHIPAPPPPPGIAAVATPEPASVPARRPRRNGRLLGGALVAALAVGAGGLAVVARSDQAAASPLAAAVARTEAVRTARVEVVVEAPGMPAPFTMRGELDFRSQAARFEIDASSLTGRGPGRPAAVDSRVEVITQGAEAYLKVGALSTLSDRAPQWFKVDASALPGGAAGPLPAGAGLDPGALLSLLKAEADSVTVAGTESLDGVTVTHHVARFDLARLARAEGTGLSPEDAERLFAGPAGLVVTADLWVGDDGLLRRLTVATTTPEGPVRVDLRLRDFGAAVTVTPPAADQVLDLTSLLGR
jgi:hypothetical protein